MISGWKEEQLGGHAGSKGGRKDVVTGSYGWGFGFSPHRKLYSGGGGEGLLDLSGWITQVHCGEWIVLNKN